MIDMNDGNNISAMLDVLKWGSLTKEEKAEVKWEGFSCKEKRKSILIIRSEDKYWQRAQIRLVQKIAEIATPAVAYPDISKRLLTT